MAAEWQVDPDAAYNQARAWWWEVSIAKSWTSTWNATAEALFETALDHAKTGSWFETDETTAAQFWERLSSDWNVISETSGSLVPSGWTKLGSTFGSAITAAGSAAAEGVDADDVVDQVVTEVLPETAKTAKGGAAIAIMVLIAIALLQAKRS